VRLLPHLIARMWMRLAGEDGFAAVVYGPCELRGRIGDAAVRIVEETAYPVSDTVELVIEPERPVDFTLVLRQPGWAGGMDVAVPGADPVFADGWCRIRKRWTAGDRVRIAFAPEVRAEAYANGEVAVLRGPLQYVLPLEHRLERIREYPGEGLHDYDVLPTDIAQGYRIPLLDAAAPGLGLAIEPRPGEPDRPWDRASSVLRHADATLVPIGCTILRRAAFPVAGGVANGAAEAGR